MEQECVSIIQAGNSVRIPDKILDDLDKKVGDYIRIQI